MAGEKARDASAASRDLIMVLAEPSNKDGFYGAVVDFGTSAKVVHPASKTSDLLGCLADLQVGFFDGSTNITDGLRHAQDILSNFTPADARHQLRPVVVLFSDGCHNVGRNPDAIAASLRAKADLICIAFGQDADEAGLRRWASPQLFTRCTNGADLRKFFAAVGATMRQHARGEQMQLKRSPQFRCRESQEKRYETRVLQKSYRKPASSRSGEEWDDERAELNDKGIGSIDTSGFWPRLDREIGFTDSTPTCRSNGFD